MPWEPFITKKGHWVTIKVRRGLVSMCFLYFFVWLINLMKRKSFFNERAGTCLKSETKKRVIGVKGSSLMAWWLVMFLKAWLCSWWSQIPSLIINFSLVLVESHKNYNIGLPWGIFFFSNVIITQPAKSCKWFQPRNLLYIISKFHVLIDEH